MEKRESRQELTDKQRAAVREAERQIEEAERSGVTELRLIGLGLVQLPNSAGRLALLRTLDLRHNQLTSLPDSLGQLAQLQRLIVGGNQLTSLPVALRRLTRLEELLLHDNPTLGIPPEVLGPTIGEIRMSQKKPATPASILDYYFRTQRWRRPLNEAKLILVGRGGVGKTCLVERLIHDTFNPNESETPGIDIHPWEVKIATHEYFPARRTQSWEPVFRWFRRRFPRWFDSPVEPPQDASRWEDVRLHVWDFGGQRILHGTHQFFLTERTLYLVVLSGREDSATLDAEYWLQLIQSLGGQSRVIVALNKINLYPFDVNRGLLLEKYPAIAGFVRTDCADATGIAELHELICRETDALEHRKTAFPAQWFDIKERLATMPENFISWEQYQAICTGHGETDLQAQRGLARFLHILGIALHYADDPRLYDTRVLKPTWVTEGIYTLLRAGQHDQTGGVLQPTDLGRVLDPANYPPERHDFLLRLMEKFQLCFRLPGPREHYLVPELLDEDQPDIAALLHSTGLGFRYQYEVLPEGLLPRFIVQTHQHSESHPEWRWRTGVVLACDGCQAVVRADVRERRVDIHITGPEPRRRGVLAIIRERFDEQHRELKGLRVEERVPVPYEDRVTESYRHLLYLEEKGEEWCWPTRATRKHRVADLLNGVESEESRKQRRAILTQMGSFHSRKGSSMEGINKVTGCDNSNRAADVVFVHGLDGDATVTWQTPGNADGFWPAWIGNEFPNIGVWTLGYAVSSSSWKGHAMPLADRAKWTLDQFDLKRMGTRPVMFVCHSLGGLLIKQALRLAHESKNAQWKSVVQQTRVILFLSTPHSGADIASWIKYVGTILRTTVAVEELEAHHHRLRELNEWYRDNVGDLRVTTFVYCEKLQTNGILVVNETTADPGIPGVRPIPLDENHISICKPATKGHPVYERAVRLLTDHVLVPR